MSDDGTFGLLEDFSLCCPSCGASLGSYAHPTEIPECCYNTLINEIIRIRKAILQHRQDTGSDDGEVLDDTDNELYESIGQGRINNRDDEDDCDLTCFDETIMFRET